MPRGGRSGGGGRSRSPSPSRRSTTFSQAPPRQYPTHTAQPVRQGGMFSGLGSMFMGGMALGAGSEIGHRAMGGVMGGRGNEQVQPYESQYQASTESYNQQPYPCQAINDNFVECLKKNSDSIGMCQTYLDELKQCEKRVNGPNGLASNNF